MNANPALKRLGFAERDRVAIIHADDIGMSHASYAAFTDLWRTGIVSSGAVMVPCPWFAKVATYCRANTNVDLGVHLTLTSEWDGYRWGPLSTRDRASGMIDGEGYFFRSTRQLWANAPSEVIAAELQAQIDTARAAGMQPTHLDTHMGALLYNTALAPMYAQIALNNRLPAMIPRRDATKLAGAAAVANDVVVAAERMISEFDEQGVVMVDQVVGMPLEKPEHRLKQVYAAIDALPAGITHFIIHPSHDTPEARAISPDLPSRIGDYETFMDECVREKLKQAGVQVIGYRHLLALLA
jgi:predicted glycoside hydrolase/deacetylase ChbG (UPF0249 family)